MGQQRLNRAPLQSGLSSEVTTGTLSKAIIALVVAGICVCSLCTCSLDLDLNLSVGSPLVPSTETVFLESIFQDKFEADFKITIQLVEYIESAARTFATHMRLDLASEPDGLLSSWFGRKLGLSMQAAGGEVRRIMETARGLNFVYANDLWPTFRRLLVSVITERPANMDQSRLAFRCDEKTAQISQLHQLSSQSLIMSIIMETFSSELYTHCLKRKLALVQLLRLSSPSSVVRQFVDIYLSPDQEHGLSLVNGPPGRAATERALDFKLQESFAKHGPVERVASLVVGSLANIQANYHYDTAAKFRRDCASYSARLGQVWASLDSLANFLSSTFTNLFEFNRQVKLIAPPLMYASICSQLATL